MTDISVEIAEMPTFGTIREFREFSPKGRHDHWKVDEIQRIDGTLFVVLRKDGASYWSDPELCVVDLPTFVREWE